MPFACRVATQERLGEPEITVGLAEVENQYGEANRNPEA
jgi:hypothetical protein